MVKTGSSKRQLENLKLSEKPLEVNCSCIRMVSEFLPNGKSQSLSLGPAKGYSLESGHFQIYFYGTSKENLLLSL